MDIDGTTAALIILSLGTLAGFIGAGFFYLETESLNAEVDELESTVSDLEDDKTQLQSDKKDLQQKVSKLESDRTALESEVADAESLSESVLTYLSLTEESCDAAATDFSGVDQCVEAHVTELENEPDIGSTRFTNYMPPDLPEGELVLENYGERTLDGTAFTLYHNSNLEDDDGCANRDTVEPEYSCTLNFYETCSSGDVLEVRYDGSSVYTYSC